MTRAFPERCKVQNNGAIHRAKTVQKQKTVPKGDDSNRTDARSHGQLAKGRDLEAAVLM